MTQTVSLPEALQMADELDALVCRATGLRVREQDAQAISRWAHERAHALRLANAEEFARLLAEDGYLVTAHSELFGHEIAPLRVRMHPQSAVYLKGVVFGMPRRAIELGAALHVLPLEAIAPALIRAASRTASLQSTEALSP